ncbi:hypothetical protein BD324DRAFT_444260 [Kockovaella imperatae]|uniref:PinX1-related protein 1 n=1 Tax=Kockovaella imperatae TaxID=4999 RepID=A0A1Y1UH92_9TREE|nr:hypothetical protein BD324DRAFT_444260 [Kockovaella imperatae]ORX37359.1 hypothetical protein BD324DRAFT_444260 [Kockovaella imperatae]
MGLSERKNKQRIGLDPRNLTWSNDTSRFSYQHLKSLGWSSSSGIGGSGLDGNPNHIAVVKKLDNGGIGMARARKEGDDNAAGAGPAGRNFEDVLKRLAGNSPSESPSGASTPVEQAVEKKRNKIASRQKHLQSKRLASSSPAALAEILGVPVSSLPASPLQSTPTTPAPVDTPSPATPSDPTEPERTVEEGISKSTLSVSDYFRQKMRDKMKARQGMSGDSPGPPAEPLALKGTDPWEGSRTTFEETESGEGSSSSPAVNPTATTVTADDEKAAKKAKKEARRQKKMAKTSDEGVTANANAGTSDNLPALPAVVEGPSKKDKKEKKKRKLETEQDVTEVVESSSDRDEKKKKKKSKKK